MHLPTGRNPLSIERIDPRIFAIEPQYGMPVFDAALTWTPTGLTTVRLVAKSTVDESFTTGAAGIQRRDVSVELEHAFRRWLIGTAKVAYGNDLYAGTTRQDQRLVASLGVVYKANRMLQIRGEVRREIVCRVASRLEMYLTDDIISLVAARFGQHARQLIGAVHRLKAAGEAHGEPMTCTLAEETLADLAPEAAARVFDTARG